MRGNPRRSHMHMQRRKIKVNSSLLGFGIIFFLVEGPGSLGAIWAAEPMVSPWSHGPPIGPIWSPHVPPLVPLWSQNG